MDVGTEGLAIGVEERALDRTEDVEDLTGRVDLVDEGMVERVVGVEDLAGRVDLAKGMVERGVGVEDLTGLG